MNSFKQYNIHQILLGVLVGENDAFFNELHRRYADTLFGVCYNMLGNEKDAEEARNDVLLKIQTYLQTQRSEKTEWTEKCVETLIRNPEGYFHKIARNLCIDMLRTRRQSGQNEIPSSDIALTSEISDKNDIENGDFLSSIRLIDKEDESMLVQLLHKLEQIECDCMKLHYIEDYSYREIAEIFTITKNDVKVIMKRAQRKLKAIINESGSEASQLLYS